MLVNVASYLGEVLASISPAKSTGSVVKVPECSSGHMFTLKIGPISLPHGDTGCNVTLHRQMNGSQMCMESR